MPERWERRDDETSKSFAAFCVYRGLGPARSLVTCRQNLGTVSVVSRTIERWSSSYDWPARAHAYDAHLDNVRRGAIEDSERDAAFREHLLDLRKFAQEAKDVGRLILLIARRSGRAYSEMPPETLTPADVSRLLRTGMLAFEAGMNAEAVSLGLSETLGVQQVPEKKAGEANTDDGDIR